MCRGPHCTWGPCWVAMAALQYSGHFQPGTPLAYFPREEEQKWSQKKQRERACAKAWALPPAPLRPRARFLLSGPRQGMALSVFALQLLVTSLLRNIWLGWETFVTEMSLLSISAHGTKPNSIITVVYANASSRAAWILRAFKIFSQNCQ